MVSMTDFRREALFLAKQRSIVIFLAVVFFLSVFAVWTGVSETLQQHETIARLLEKDKVDRLHAQEKQSSYGGAAYYSFHLTYSEPSSLAFAAMGQRDVYPWKHRIRMLALEGQIYETDVANPELAFLGRFDFAFLTSVLLPLFVILLLHDLRSSEREVGRFDLLVVTARNQNTLWTARALVLSSAMAVALLLPFFIGAIFTKASFFNISLMALIGILHLAFWTLVTIGLGNVMTKHAQSSSRIASALLAVWLVLVVILPVVSDTVINKTIESPNGGEIMLVQREAVNDAWDLPLSTTWDAFLETHPQWADKTQMNSMFEWKWYYAFQQVGDQKAAKLSNAYREAIIKKDKAAAVVSIFSPPMLTQRLMTSLANTDVTAALEYEQKVRDYHLALRKFYYPLLFNESEYNLEMFKDMPQF